MSSRVSFGWYLRHDVGVLFGYPHNASDGFLLMEGDVGALEGDKTLLTNSKTYDVMEVISQQLCFNCSVTEAARTQQTPH